MKSSAYAKTACEIIAMLYESGRIIESIAVARLLVRDKQVYNSKAFYALTTKHPFGKFSNSQGRGYVRFNKAFRKSSALFRRCLETEDPS